MWVLCTTVYTVCGVLLYNAAVAIILCIGEPPPVQCPPLDNPENGVVDITDDVATYSCLSYYQLVGDIMRICVDGEWSGDAPNCTLSKYNMCGRLCSNGSECVGIVTTLPLF